MNWKPTLPSPSCPPDVAPGSGWSRGLWQACVRHGRLRGLTLKFFALAFSVFCLGPVTAPGHVPVAESVLHPRTAPEAWNILRLVTANTERLLREDRLAEIPDQIALCNPALRTLPDFAATPALQSVVKAGVVRTGITINSLAQGCLAGDRPFVSQSLVTLQADLRVLQASFDPNVVQADIFVCPMHPEFASTDPHAHCEKCGMALVPRRIPYRSAFTTPGLPTLHFTATAEPLQAGRAVHGTIQLAHANGSPVLLNELMVVHTQPIHLLIVDASLQDYHHEHPTPTTVPGEYAFSFTPAKSCRYRVFADLVPMDTGAQEYPFVDLVGTSDVVEKSDRTSTASASAGGLNFHLDWQMGSTAPLRANQAQILRITVTAPDGKPMTRLEPVMAAFAHLVGFYDDGHTVVHLHPEGGEALNSGDRGGPALNFRFYPLLSGYLRLYCQVQVNGQAVYAAFNTTIAP